jgi:DNA helicase-2/ATP-dependent DNA helicase PcrA
MSGTAGGAKREEPFEHLKVGDLVQHVKFGIGQVTQVIGENEKELYNVEFKTAGKRLLDPRFAKLIKLS